MLNVPKPLQHAWVDDRHAPTYVLTFPENPGEDELMARNAEIQAWYKKLDHQIGWVVDCTKLVEAPARIRQLQTDHVKRIDPYQAHWDVCDAFVIDSPLVRGYMTAIYWFSPPPYEYQTFATIAPAMRWVRSRCVARDLPLADRAPPP